MKLRKALDKAREALRPDLGHGPIFAEEVATPQADSHDAVSPVYSQSTSVTLDPVRVRRNRCVCISSDAAEIDAYKVLRTQILQKTREKGWNTVMITSAIAGEGKTLTAINLALTFAKEFNQTVLLVDADLKRQKIYQYLGYESKKGLVDYLVDDKPMHDLIVWPGIEKLTVISGGRTIRDSSEILGSARMKEMVTEMKNRYHDRYVLFNVPPLLSGADAIAFSPLADCIIMVVEAGRTPIQDIQAAAKLIPPEKFLGFVLNRHQRE